MRKYKSPFLTDSPFTKNGKEINESISGFAQRYGKNSLSIIADSSIDYRSFYQDLISFLDKNVGLIQNEQLNQKKNRLDTKIFIYENFEELDKLYEIAKPEPNEVCFFIKDKSGELDGWDSCHIKVGSYFLYKLVEENGSGLDIENDVNFYRTGLLENSDLMVVLNKGGGFQNIVASGQLNNISKTVFFGILKFVNIVNIISAPLFDFIADKIQELTKILRNNIKFQPHHWDPKAKIKAPNHKDEKNIRMIENNGFKPVLFPFSDNVLDNANELSNKLLRKAISTFKNQLDQRQKDFSDTVNFYRDSILKFSEGFKNSITPELKKLIDRIILLLNTLSRKSEKVKIVLVQGIDGVFSDLKHLGKKIINTINAYYCGIWNSLMDSLIGIIDIIGIVFRAFALQGKLLKAPLKNFKKAAKIFDNLINAFLKIEFKEVLLKIRKFFKRLNFKALIKESITIERIAYFMGAVIGFFIELAISLIFTAGSATVVSGIKKVLSNLRKGVLRVEGTLRVKGDVPIRFDNEKIKKIDIFQGLKKLENLLKGGTKGLNQALEILFEEFLNLYRITDIKILDHIKDKFTTKQLKEMKYLGLSFVSYKKGMAKACPLLLPR